MRPFNFQGSTAMVFFLACVFLLQGCLQTSRINTDPPGAQIMLNGAPLGKTPIYYNTRAGIPKTYFLEIEKSGCKKVETKLESNYRADLSLALLIPGIVPYFFSARLEDDYKFILLPSDSKSTC
ncbi:MAG: PEGA domain-containing protein [Nitrospirales bacterium]|nr:PEGA domain-containing protein [Nitrospira sp.]MDR4502220.1 PEGA domain-containing protein [Nitrospirales bacterium]